MTTIKEKRQYLLTCLKKHLAHRPHRCPSCGCATYKIVDRKFIVTALARCQGCQLLFRIPTTTEQESALFYQKAFNRGFTTDMPSDETLNSYVKNIFKGTEKDYSSYIDVVRCANGGNDIKLFDYGCSWGYGSWQLIHSGFNVEAYDISAPRAAFARMKLGIKVYPALSKATGRFDCFFSCHVLEHLPAVKDIIDFGFQILKSGGTFIAFTPNGSLIRREIDPHQWRQQWGMTHLNMMDEKYYAFIFKDKPYFITSSPYETEKIVRWRKNPCQVIDQTNGLELLIIVKK